MDYLVIINKLNRKGSKMKGLLLIILAMFVSNASFAEDQTIEMLNKLDKRIMV